jgi:hypothetical protein
LETSVQLDDLVRKRRNQAIYDVAGLITESEARSILEHAISFVDIVRGRIDHEQTSG